MTVSELIRALANYAPGADVVFEYTDFMYGTESALVTGISKEDDLVVLHNRSERESQP